MGSLGAKNHSHFGFNKRLESQNLNMTKHKNEIKTKVIRHKAIH